MTLPHQSSSSSAEHVAPDNMVANPTSCHGGRNSPERINSASSGKDKSTGSKAKVIFPTVIEQVNYRIMVVPEPFTTDMGAPADAVDQGTQEVRLYLQPDADAIPFGWIHRLMEAKNDTCQSLRSIKIFVQALEHRYVADLSESSWSRDEFLYLQELFEAHGITWEIFFRRAEPTSDNSTSIDSRIFSKVDTNQLLDVLRATVAQHD
jgi:hypothetical protein